MKTISEILRKRIVLWGVIVLVLLVVFLLSWNFALRLRAKDRAVLSFTMKSPPPPPAEQIEIMAWNIAHGRGTVESNWDGGNRDTRRARLETIARKINHYNPDIVVLNEVDFRSTWSYGINQAEFFQKSTGYAYRIEQRNFDFGFPFLRYCFGNAILSRFPLEDAEFVDYPAKSELEDLLAGKKQGVICTVELEEKPDFRLLAVHFEFRSPEVRRKTAKEILSLTENIELPLVAAGDFNSTPPDFPMAAPGKDGKTALQILLDSEWFKTLPVSAPENEDFTFHSLRPGKVIDWVLVPETWKILSRKVPDIPLSDHRPVIYILSPL